MMQSLLLILATIVCGLAGWFLGAARHEAPLATPPAAVPSIPSSTLAPPISSDEMQALAERLKTALAEIRKNPSGTEQMVETARLVAGLTSEQIPTALVAMDPAGNGSNRSLLLEHWAAIDFPTAKAWVMNLPAAARLKSIHPVGAEWARREPKAVMDWISSFSGTEKTEVINALGMATLAQAAGNDPERALAMIREADVPNVQNDREKNFYMALGQKAPADAAVRVMQMPAGADRTNALASVVRQWAETDPKAAKTFWESVNDASLSTALAPALVEGWAGNDPHAAVEFLSDLPATTGNLAALPRLLAEWSNRDPDAALAWLDRQPKGSLGFDAYGAVLNKVGERNPEGALQLLLKREAANLPTAYAGYVRPLSMLATSDSEEAAFKRLEGLHQMGGTELTNNLSAHFAGSLAQRFPDRVVQWASALPVSEKRRFILDQVALNLVTTNPPKAIAFARTLPIDANTAPVIAEVAYQSLLHSPEQALPLYERVADAEQRRILLKNHVFSWIHENGFSAREKMSKWVAQSDLFSPEEKQALLNPLRSK